jgi:hypothetical protein
MRSLVALSFLLISLAFAGSVSPIVAFAQEDCRCKGCGCKGGPGWRGPEGTCVPEAKLAEICGTPADAPCKLEASPQVCFGKEAARSATPVETKAQ